MILQLLGIIAIFLFTKSVFRVARDNGRNAARWALLNFGVGIGTQIILPIIIGVSISTYLVFTGDDPAKIAKTLEGWATLVTVGCFAASFFSMFVILQRAAQMPDESEIDLNVPPPPPTFSGQE